MVLLKRIGTNIYANHEKMEDNECVDGNPFDNKVVIIDEAHNFISRIANKLKDQDPLIY